MHNYLNILVFPGGTEIGLEIHRALSHCKEVRLFSAGIGVSNHASYVFTNHFKIPSIHEQGWIDALNKVIDDNSIDYIFPAYDDIIVALAQNANFIHAKLIASPIETCLITRSKSATYRHLANFIPVPIIFEDKDIVDQYPVFVKPDRGQGSVNAKVIQNRMELEAAINANDEMLILEYLPGEEYTVDCFSDRDAGLLFCGGRRRIRTKSGISLNCTHVIDPIFEDYAKCISEHLVFCGAWFFQVKKDCRGTFKLLEIAPRIAGTMALHRVQGINFPLLSIYEQERIQLTILKNNVNIEIDRALTNRYRHNISYSTAYIDLDDTLILNESINLMVIRFVFQCLNKGIKIILLTKHAENVNQTLIKYRLNGIFDDVIHIHKSQNKFDFIKGKNAILIDDSFSERKAVTDMLGILTFDCSMLELLLDDRS